MFAELLRARTSWLHTNTTARVAAARPLRASRLPALLVSQLDLIGLLVPLALAGGKPAFAKLLRTESTRSGADSTALIAADRCISGANVGATLHAGGLADLLSACHASRDAEAAGSVAAGLSGGAGCDTALLACDDGGSVVVDEFLRGSCDSCGRATIHAGRVAIDHLASDSTLDILAGFDDGVGGDGCGAEGHADQEEDLGDNHSL